MSQVQMCHMWECVSVQQTKQTDMGEKAGEQDHTVPVNKWEVHYRLGQVATLSNEREVS
jgi:hypothetical protein